MQQPIVHTRDTTAHDRANPLTTRPRETPTGILRWALPLIVMLLAGCDNVNWGGANFAIVPPPPGEARAADPSDDGGEPAEEAPPTGPVLYYVRALGDEALLVPVAEIDADTLLPIEPAQDWERYGQRFITQGLRQGTEFALFHHGERAGTFVLQSAMIPGEEVCPRTPRATGILELVASARDVTEFLAIPKTYAPPGGRRRAAINLDADRRLPLQAAILAERALRARNARLPNNWTRAMTQLQIFPVTGSADPAFASTFVLGDSTGRGANPAGYSLFLIAQPRPQVGYDTTYVAFTDYATSGRAAPRVIDFLDWGRTGNNGLLLEVSSGQDNWFEAIALHDGQWRTILQTRCEGPPPAPTATEEETTAG